MHKLAKAVILVAAMVVSSARAAARLRCGHCSVIVAAGSASGMVQRYLDWNEHSHGALRFRQGCGGLVIGAGFYLVWSAN